MISICHTRYGPEICCAAMDQTKATNVDMGVVVGQVKEMGSGADELGGVMGDGGLVEVPGRTMYRVYTGGTSSTRPLSVVGM